MNFSPRLPRIILTQVEEGIPICDVIDKDDSIATPEIGFHESVEPLLTCSKGNISGTDFRSFARKLSKRIFLSPVSNLQFWGVFKMIDHSGDIPGNNIERTAVAVSQILRF
jgi:hypothetical protein